MNGDTASVTARSGNALGWGLFDESVGPFAFMLSNALAARSVHALAPFGLPSGSLSVLTLIHANPGCSQTDISRTTGMSKSGVVGLIDELERRGLAVRSQAEGDRRRNVLTLTAKGEAQLDRMARVQLAEEDPIKAELSSQELQMLNALLRRAFTALQGSAQG